MIGKLLLVSTIYLFCISICFFISFFENRKSQIWFSKFQNICSFCLEIFSRQKVQRSQKSKHDTFFICLKKVKKFPFLLFLATVAIPTKVIVSYGFFVKIQTYVHINKKIGKEGPCLKVICFSE